MEPASSSDDESSSSDDDSIIEPVAQNFNDLPSDDSCLEDSDADSDSDNEGSQNDGDEGEDEDDMTLEERLHSKRHQGVIRNKRKVDAKKKALAIAQKKLRELKRKRADGSDTTNTDDGKKRETLKKNDEREKKPKKKKSRPAVVSSLRSDFYRRGAPDLNSSGIGVTIGANKYKPRDPRMQSMCGHYDENLFDRRYGFLEEIKSKEIEDLKARCRAWKTSGKKGQKLRKKLGLTSGESTAEDDQAQLNQLIQERASHKEAKVRSAAKSAVKKKLRDDVASGKRGAYYLKKRDMKKMELEARFEQLKKVGGDSAINKVMAKRRKKKMSSDSAFMPSSV